MKGKVNCTCGWSWNKSDSSAKDMYICHECGRDNSNNMKNGGWLNSYQNGGDTDNEDYNMKRALELGYTPDDTGHWPSVDYETGEWLKSKKHHTRGMEMMAYELNPELRNKYNLIENEKGVLQYVDKKDFKNGGWLDQYASGGTMQEYQENYNDSKATASPDMVGDGFSNVGRNYSPAWGGQFEDGGEIPNAQKGKKVKYVESENDPRYKAFQDSLLAYTTLDKYKNIPKNIPFKKEDEKNIRKIWASNLEPLARDFSNPRPLTDRSNGNIERADYFTPTKYKKPQQQVIVKEQEKRKPVKTIQNNLQPKGLIQSDAKLNTDIKGLKPQVRQPKYYDIQENINQPFGAYQNNYRISDLNNITSPDDLGPGNTRKITPRYQDGGNTEAAMRGMMKSKIGMGNAFGHPAIRRMSQAMPKTGMTPEGIGTHYMSSVDNYAVPLLQDLGEEELILVDPDSRSREAIRFNSPEEAQYFAEHYKDVAPMSNTYKGLQEYAMGGSIPQAQNGRATRADSLAVFNNTKAIDDYFKKQGYTKEKVKDSKIYKERIKNYKEWVTSAQKYLKEAKNEPVNTFYTQTDKNKNIAEQKKFLKEAQKRLYETIDKNNPKNYIKKLEDSKKIFETKEKDVGRYVDEQNNLVEGKPSVEKFYLPVDENKFYQREQSQGFLDLRSPMPLYDKRITPQDLSTFKSPDSVLGDQLLDKIIKSKNKKEKEALKKQMDALVYSDNVEMYEYDPIAIMPFDMVPPELQEERIRKYGTEGVPASFIEQHPDWVAKPITDSGQRQPIQAIQNNLKPEGLIQSDAKLSADALTLRPKINQPKSFDVTSQRQTMSGPSDYYDYDQQGLSAEQVMEIQASADKYNRGVIDKYGEAAKTNLKAKQRLDQLLQDVKLIPNYAMGGSIPGSVGFTYARTKGIPSNGPYAKKTLASAQNGVDMYGNPITADLKYDQSVNRTNYNPRTNQMIFGNDMPYFVSQEKIDKTLAHENRHAWQFANDRTNFNIVHNPEYAFQDRLKKKPEHPSTEEVFENYHDRKRREVEIDVKNFKSNYPELSFMPDSLIYKKFVDPLQYNNPSSVEGEAQYYENTGERSFQNGGEMKFYQNGLDFKPKSISRDGGWLNKYDVAQNGKKKFKLKDEREDAYTVRDNIQPLSLKQKRGNELLIKETEKAKKDKQELTTTGQIKNPRSIRYKKLAPKQSDLKTQTKSNEELEGQLGLERPLVYLASPEKLLGDIGVPGMETSELDRQAVMANRFNPNQSREERFINNTKLGLGYVPEAAANTAMAAAFMPEGSGALGLVNEALNPLAGLKMSIAPELRSGEEAARFFKKVDNIDDTSDLIKEKVNPFQFGKIINKSITPIGYDPFTVAAAPLELLTPNALKFKPKTYATKNRLDAWKLYNGLEPEFNTFSKNPDGTLAINDFRLDKNQLEDIINNPKKSFGTMEIESEFNFGGVHGNGWITKGVDEQGKKFIDFTDTWDLQPLKGIKFLPKKVKEFEVSSLTGGAPFDLKNRIYYDDSGKFFDHNGNELIEEIQNFPKGIVKENEAVDIPMLSTANVAGTKQTDVLNDWNKAVNQKFKKGAASVVGGGGAGLAYLVNKEKEKSKKKKEGGVIKDDMGQWKYPGEITQIGSNQITMEGVPYDVLGISDTGDTKLMEPGKNYKFKGKKVTEFPMAKNGRRQEQKGLVNLDDLTNFTNYNKQQPAGWLSKYN